jgi:predicted Kef-type K+ transport protein
MLKKQFNGSKLKKLIKGWILEESNQSHRLEEEYFNIKENYLINI